MPLLLLLILALAAGLAIGLLVWALPRRGASPPTALASARRIGETIGRHRFLRRVLHARLDPAAATGLALTLAMMVVIGGGVLFGLLAYLVRSNVGLHEIDNGVAKWGNAHATALSTHGLNAVTWLGSIYAVVVLCVILAVVETIAERSVWVVPFIVAEINEPDPMRSTAMKAAYRAIEQALALPPAEPRPSTRCSPPTTPRRVRSFERPSISTRRCRWGTRCSARPCSAPATATVPARSRPRTPCS